MPLITPPPGDTPTPPPEPSGIIAKEFYAIANKDDLTLENTPLEDAMSSLPPDTYVLGYLVCLDTDSN